MRVLMLRSFAGVLLFLSFTNLCHGQTATATSQLFYEDTTASQRVINQLAVDNAGDIISFTLQTSGGCGFGICGAVVYSIAPNGSLNWVTPSTNFIGNTVNEIAISSNNNIFFQDTFSLGQIRGLSASGVPLPNWPVILGDPLDTFSLSLLIDPVDQSVLAKGGAASAFLPPLTRTASFQQDGTTKWIADFPAGGDNTPGMLIGPNSNLYTFSDHTLLLDRNDGHTVCEFPSAGGDSFAPITGGDGLVFSYTNTGVQRSDSGCIAFPIYNWDTGRRGQLLGYDHGVVFGFDLPLNGIAGNPRFIAISKDGALLWHNDSINPLSIAGANQGFVYVVGIDVNVQCCNDQKLFILDETNGNLVSSVDITAICPACVKVAVGSNGVYVGDLSSTRIYKVNIGSEWRMEGVNPSRTNVALVKGPETIPSFKVLASNITGNLRRIALDGSLILIDRLENNNFGTVSSYAKDGTPKWKQTLVVGGFGIIDAAVGVDGIVYVSTGYSVTALDGNTGSTIWSFSANAGDESSKLAIGKDGTIYFHNGGGIGFFEALTAINPDGTPKWQTLTGFNRGSGRVVFNTDESLVYLLTGKTCCGGLPIGNISSFSTLDGHKVNDTPCDPRGDIYAFSQWNTLYSGNTNNDLLAFTPDIQTCNVISADGMIAVGIASTTTTGRIITANNDGTLGGLDQQGNLLWHSTEPLSQAFSSIDAVVYAVAPATNDFVALDSEHGSVLWRQHFNDPITGQFLADDGNIYLTAGTTLFVSTPAPPTGTISVSTNNANATFTITGPVAYSGNGHSFTQTNAPSGTYTINYGAVLGYIAPHPQSLKLDPGGTITFYGIYTISPPSISQISPGVLTRGQTNPQFTVVGLNFQPCNTNDCSSSTISFGGTGATVVAYSKRTATEIVATVSVTRDAPLSVQSVTVTNPDGQQATQAVGIVIRRRPVIVIPGILGSVLRRSDNGLVVWLDATSAFESPNFDNGCDTFLLPLALDTDGQSPASDISANCGIPLGNIKSAGTAMFASEVISNNPFTGERIFYGSLLDGLSDFPVTGFPYDWRLDYRTIAPQLRDLISSLAPNPWDRVDVVAHSQGGLIARTYMGMVREGQLSGRVSSTDTRVDTIVYLGTPHLGATKSYAILKDWQPIENYYGLLFSFPGIILNTQTMIDITQNFTGVYELLPRYNFYSLNGEFQQFDTTYTDTTDGTALRNQKLVNTASKLWTTILSSDAPTSRSFAVNGSGQNTLRALIKIPGTHCVVPGNDPLGDGEVPFLSSSAAVGTQNFFVNVKHENLPSDQHVQTVVRELLDDTDPSNIVGPSVKNQPFSSGKNLVGYTCSPVVMTIVDIQGNIDGVDSRGNIRAQIPSSDFFHLSDTEGVLLADNQQYRVSLTATDAGMFTLVFDLYDGSLNTGSIRFNDVPISNLSKANLTLSPTNASPILTVDIDGDGTTDYTVNANQPPPPTSLTLVLIDIISRLKVSRDFKEGLEERLREITRQLQKQHKHVAAEQIESVRQTIIAAQERGSISESDATILLKLVDQALLVTGDDDEIR